VRVRDGEREMECERDREREWERWGERDGESGRDGEREIERVRETVRVIERVTGRERKSLAASSRMDWERFCPVGSWEFTHRDP